MCSSYRQQFFAGIDVSKNHLDLVVVEASGDNPVVAPLRVPNTATGYPRIVERLEGRPVRRIAVEATGGYEQQVVQALQAAGVSVVTCLLLAGIAPATDPAATVDVVTETRSKGPLTETVLGVVAIDDAFGIMLFSVLIVIAQMAGDHAREAGGLVLAARELGGGVIVGLLFGLPMALLTGRIRSGQLTLLETLGFVLCGSGVASLLGVSYIIVAMVQGAVVANLARHHARPFHAIENVTQPFLVVFFLLAGLKLDLSTLKTAGLIGLVYVAVRTLGRVAFGALGARIGGADPLVRKYVGWCLLPQAGVALGLGLLAADEFPEVGDQLLSLLVATTVVFEIAGPFVTRVALQRATASQRDDIGPGQPT